jgi:hypothetical protein
VLGEKNDGLDVGPADDETSVAAVPHCPPPRWATGLRRVLYPDVAMDECEGEGTGAPSGS